MGSEVSEKESAEQPGSGLRVNASLTGKLNLADYQNAVPALRELAIANNTDLMREHLVVSVSSDPCFFKPKRWHGERATEYFLNLLQPTLESHAVLPHIERLETAAQFGTEISARGRTWRVIFSKNTLEAPNVSIR